VLGVLRGLARGVVAVADVAPDAGSRRVACPGALAGVGARS